MEQVSEFLLQQIRSGESGQLSVQTALLRKQRDFRSKAVCTDSFTAEATRLHNDANILALGGRVVGPGLAVKIVETFLNTPFSNDERHIRRINQIETE